MNRAALLIAAGLSIAPRAGSAQVSVTAPAAGATSSYRATVVSWDPIPGASSYHLEIDDDPNFGSPEVDVTVPGTSYALAGERLNLNGHLSWAAYVRINGVRWNANTFTPSYFRNGWNPAVAVDSQSRVHLAFEARTGQVTPLHVTTSNDWSSTTRISLESTFNVGGLDLGVDEHDVVHALWYEQNPFSNSVTWAPYYANSAAGWDLVSLPGPIAGGCSEPSLVAGGGQIDLFHASCWSLIHRWTSTDGVQFTQTPIDENDIPISVSAGRDGAGNLYIASERYTTRWDDLHSSVRTSADGWLPHRIGPGRFPTLAVTPTGVLHALRWRAVEEGADVGFRYSNSLRGFQTWTDLPARLSYTNQDIHPLVVDDTRQQLHAAITGEDGIQLCSAANTGRAEDTGTSWTCAIVGQGDSHHPDLALAPDGTLHLAWSAGPFGVGYANSLGSFLARNFAPQLSLGAPSNGASAITIPTAISDADGDPLSGDIRVGQYEPVVSLIEPGTGEEVFGGRYGLANPDNYRLRDPASRLQFRAPGGYPDWDTTLYRDRLPPLPAIIEVRNTDARTVGALSINAWDDTGATIAEIKFVPHVTLAYSGTLPEMVNISAVPDGKTMLAVNVWDGATAVQRTQAFTKSAGQDQLLLTPAATAAEQPTITTAP